MEYLFVNDYSEGCHPNILKTLNHYNLMQQTGYGLDQLSTEAKASFKQKADAPNADVYFVSGGTQANLICLASMLQPFEAVISASTGHIAVNEAGAIEATGHKIISVPAVEGKLTVAAIAAGQQRFSRFPHTVRPKVVYITNATELGTIYTKSELIAISTYCREHHLYLFMDGARLAMALASVDNDVSLADIAQLTDMFWLGGTKNGAMVGEAIMITHPKLQADFGFHIKQRGAMLAKGWFIGMQFATLFQDDLYLQLATHANTMAKKIANAMVDAGFELFSQPQSNQVFVILPHTVLTRLQKDFGCIEWERREQDSVVRLVTSWATDTKQVDRLIDVISHSQCIKQI